MEWIFDWWRGAAPSVRYQMKTCVDKFVWASWFRLFSSLAAADDNSSKVKADLTRMLVHQTNRIPLTKRHNVPKAHCWRPLLLQWWNDTDKKMRFPAIGVLLILQLFVTLFTVSSLSPFETAQPLRRCWHRHGLPLNHQLNCASGTFRGSALPFLN